MYMDLENIQKRMMQEEVMAENEELKAKVCDLQDEIKRLKMALQLRSNYDNVIEGTKRTPQCIVGQLVIVVITDLWRFGIIEGIIEHDADTDTVFGGKVRYVIGGIFEHPIQVTSDYIRIVENDPNLRDYSVIKMLAKELTLYQADDYTAKDRYYL